MFTGCELRRAMANMPINSKNWSFFDNLNYLFNHVYWASIIYQTCILKFKKVYLIGFCFLMSSGFSSAQVSSFKDSLLGQINTITTAVPFLTNRT